MLTPVAGRRLLLRRGRRIPPFSSYGGILGAVDNDRAFFLPDALHHNGASRRRSAAKPNRKLTSLVAGW
jgi:hypothetical protein